MIEAILSEAIAATLVESLFRVGGAAATGRRRRHDLARQARKPDIRRIVTSLLAQIQDATYPSRDITALAQFLRTPEALHFVQQVKIAALSSGKLRDSTGPLTSQLSSILALTLSLPKSKASVYANLLYTLISEAVASYIEAVASVNPKLEEELEHLAAQERNAGYLQILAKPTGIPANYGPEQLAATYDFAADYCLEMHASTGYIVPPNLDERKQVPIDDIYVVPSFRIISLGARPTTLRTISNWGQYDYGEEASSEDDHLELVDLQVCLYRLVILGDPGAGKSTLAQKLAHDYSAAMLHETDDVPPLVPFIVVLRDYSRMQREDKVSILDYIEKHSSYELQLLPSKGAVHYLLSTGRAVVIFDGLDELLETDRRRQITRAVEAFARKYPASPIVVTSRKQGYMQAPLDNGTFDIVVLDDFDTPSIEQYVTKWFSLHSSLKRHERETLSIAFLNESASVADLRSNPLMLALLCNVYRGLRFIPQNRAELYEKCALMLFEQWDVSRGIMSPGPLRADARFALQHLALWIYSTEGRDIGLPHHKLVQQVTKYMLNIRYEHEPRAEQAAREFVELWRGRAWVLTDVGSSPSGEPLYNFTHRTFLEYFAAVQLNRVCSSLPPELWSYLRPHLEKNEWDMVGQLAIQIANQNTEGATDQIYQLVVDSSRALPRDPSQNLLSFAARYVDSLMPSPRAVREVTRAALEHALRARSDFQAVRSYGEYIPYFTARDIYSLPLATLMGNGDSEYLEYLLNELIDYCGHLVEHADDELAAAACSLLMNMRFAAGPLMGLEENRSGGKSRLKEAVRRSRELLMQLRTRIPILSNHHCELAVTAVRVGLWSPLKLVERWGVQALFTRAPIYGAGEGAGSANTVMEYCIERFAPILSICRSDEGIEFFSGLGISIRSLYSDDQLTARQKQVDLNWLTDGDPVDRARVLRPHLWDPSLEGYRRPSTSLIELNDDTLEIATRPQDRHDCRIAEQSDALLGALYLLCVIAEAAKLADPVRSVLATDEIGVGMGFGCLEGAAPLIGARGSPSYYSEGKEVLASIGLNDQDRRLFEHWLQMRLSFVTDETVAIDETIEKWRDVEDPGDY